MVFCCCCAFLNNAADGDSPLTDHSCFFTERPKQVSDNIEKTIKLFKWDHVEEHFVRWSDINTDQIFGDDISDPQSSSPIDPNFILQAHQNSLPKLTMYKLTLLIVAALALIAVVSAQVIYTYPQTYAPIYTYPSYGYNYPLSYYNSPYVFLRR